MEISVSLCTVRLRVCAREPACGCEVRHYGSKCLNNLPLTLFSNAIL